MPTFQNAPPGLLLEGVYTDINTTVYTPAPSNGDRVPVHVSAWKSGALGESDVIVREAKVLAVCGQCRWGNNWYDHTYEGSKVNRTCPHDSQVS